MLQETIDSAVSGDREAAEEMIEVLERSRKRLQKDTQIDEGIKQQVNERLQTAEAGFKKTAHEGSLNGNTTLNHSIHSLLTNRRNSASLTTSALRRCSASSMSSRRGSAVSSMPPEVIETLQTHYNKWIVWNELDPYLRRFEGLQHMPLFFLYANADGIIRRRDSL
ncbi:hypothetical protein HK097_000846, partial [Rhizophlyctis rosea]